MENIYIAIDYLCAILVAGALAMIAFSHKEHQAARWMLVAFVVLIILRWTMWSFTTESPWWIRGIIGALFGAALLILPPLLYQWSKDKMASEEKSSAINNAQVDVSEAKARIQLAARVNPFDYQNGTEIAGIKWQSGFSDVRVLVANTTSDDYTNVDILIQPETGIAKGAVKSAFAKCNVAPAINFPAPIVLMKGKDGKTLAAHPDEDEGETISPIYRAHCEKLPPNTELEIVIATAIPADVDAVGSIFSPHRRDPKWVDVKATYKASGEIKTESHRFDLSKRG